MCLEQPTYRRYLCPLLTLFSQKGLLNTGEMWPYFYLFSRHLIYDKHLRNTFGWSHTLNSENIKLCNDTAHVYLVGDCRGPHWKEFLCKIMCLEQPTFHTYLCPLLTLLSRKDLLTYFLLFSRHLIYDKHLRNTFGCSHTLNSENIKLCNDTAHVYLVADCRGPHWKGFLCKIM